MGNRWVKDLSKQKHNKKKPFGFIFTWLFCFILKRQIHSNHVILHPWDSSLTVQKRQKSLIIGKYFLLLFHNSALSERCFFFFPAWAEMVMLHFYFESYLKFYHNGQICETLEHLTFQLHHIIFLLSKS